MKKEIANPPGASHSKKRFICRAGALFALFLLTTSRADAAVIGLNLTQDGATSGNGPTLLLATDSTGAVPQQNWNNLFDSDSGGDDVSYSQGSLVDETGAATIATISGTFDFSWGMQVGASATNNLMGNFALNGSLTVSDVPYSNYSVYVYMTSNANRPGGIGQVSLGSETFHMTSFDNSSFIEATATNAGDSVAANYALFEGLTDPTFTVTDGSFQNRIMGISAIQVVETGPAVPEPSSLVLLGLALGGLGFRRGR